MISISPIVNVPFIYRNVLEAPAYAVYIPQLGWFSRACSSYHDFLDGGLLRTRKPLNQHFRVVQLKSWRICSVCRNNNPVISSFTTNHWIFTKYNTTGATSEAWTVYPPELLNALPLYRSVNVDEYLLLCVVFWWLLFVVLFYFSWSYCMECSSITVTAIKLILV
jgi:hypothetical protein